MAPEEVDAFLAGQLAPVAHARALAHVDTCPSCRVLIGKLAEASVAAGLADTVVSDSTATTTPGTPANPITVVDSIRPVRLQPTAVDRYVIKRRLGAGGMGVVYLATDPELGRDVAIKVLRSDAHADRLRREAQALARLNHPNVVAVYDVGAHDGGMFVAMALVDGKNLREWLATEHTTAEILRVLASAARGIIAAHSAGLIHRDLTPDNLFVASDGNVLVGDFGLAREATSEERPAPATAAAESLTMTGSVLGTPAYMAPEQAAGEASERSDQFSFCVTAYEALYGLRPFAGSTLEELIANVESGELAKPQRARKVPAYVAAAIRRGLDADPERRFATMAELLAAIEPRPARRWPWLVAGAATLAIGAPAFVMTRHDRDPGADCASTKTLLDPVWNPQRSQQVADKLVERLIHRDVALEVTRGLASHATRWTQIRHDACMDTVTRRIPAEAGAAQARCLDVNRVYFEQAIDWMVTSTDYSDPATLWRRVAGLPAVEACRGAEAVRLAVGGQAHLDLMRDVAGASSASLEAFVSLRARAEAASDSPAQLEIALVEARRALALHEYKAADPALDRALLLAETLDVPSARVRALAMSARSKCAQSVDATVVLGLADAASRRLDEKNHALEIDELLDAKAQCAFKATRYDEAATAYSALVDRLVARYGKDDLLQLEPRSMLLLAYQQLGKRSEAARENAEVTRLIVKNGGGTMAAAMSATLASSQAFSAGDLREAIVQQRRAVDLWPPTGPTLFLRAQSLDQLAMLHEIDAAWTAAIETHNETLSLLTEPQPVPANELVRLRALTFRGADRLSAGDLDGAADDLQRALPLTRQLGETEMIAVAELGLGRILVQRRQWRKGAEQLREGMTTVAKLGQASSLRLGLAELALAQAQWQLGDKEAARDTARKAELDVSKSIDEARKVAVAKNNVTWREAKLAEVVRWRDEHR